MFKRTLLACGIQLALTAPVWALAALDDSDLGDVSGQEGIRLDVSASNLTMQNVFWRDGSAVTDYDLRLNQVNITPVSMTANIDIGASTATAAGVPSIGIDATIQPFEMKSVGMRIANNAGSTNTFGLWAIKTNNPTTISYFNTNGLFDGTGTAGRFAFRMEDADWYLAQPRCLYATGCNSFADSHTGAFTGNGLQTVGGAGDYNVLAFKNFTINAIATGQFTIDATKGFNFGGGTGTLSFPRISTTKAGFQLDIGVLNNIDFSGGGVAVFNFPNVAALPANYWHFGFTGDLKNVDMSLVGDTGTGIGTGFGSSGIKFSPRFEFARIAANEAAGTNEFMLEMGEPTGSFVRLSNWAALSDGAATLTTPSRATFNMGDLYLNLLAGGSGGGLSNFTTPANSSFSGTSFGAISASATAGENSVAIATRGFNLQGGARTISIHDMATGNNLSGDQTWALMPNFYNLNFNLLMYPSGHPGIPAANNRHGTGFDLTIETTGKNTAYGTPSTAGTHLIVADTAANKYVGFTNIDSRYQFLQSQLYAADNTMDYASGSGLDTSGLRFTSRDMSFDIRAGLAIGDLPNGCTGVNAPTAGCLGDARMRDDDSIVGMRWKFGGNFSFTFSPPPTPGNPATECPNGSCSYIGLSSRLVATDASKNGLYFVEPVDGTRIEWIDITGELRMLSEHVPFATDSTYEDASRIDIGYESVASQPGPTQRPFVTFATAFELAPGTTQADADVIRIRKLNLYRPPATNAVFTGAGTTYREGVDWKPGFALPGTVDGTGGGGRFYTLGEMVITGGKFYGEVNLKVQ